MTAVFVFVQGIESHSLTNLSRTLGIIITTFILVEILFVRVYGNYDVGRRKSKHIVCSISLATFFTDIFVYLQLMIMRTKVENIAEFRLRSPELLVLTFAMQVIIIMFSYCGNKIFFQLHDPEKCCIVTSSQKSLDVIVRAIQSYDKQYR